jgi:hypothetical protein
MFASTHFLYYIVGDPSASLQKLRGANNSRDTTVTGGGLTGLSGLKCQRKAVSLESLGSVTGSGLHPWIQVILSFPLLSSLVSFVFP